MIAKVGLSIKVDFGVKASPGSGLREPKPGKYSPEEPRITKSGALVSLLSFAVALLFYAIALLRGKSSSGSLEEADSCKEFY